MTRINSSYKLQFYYHRLLGVGRKLWHWRLVAPNGQIIATDGNQGYENYKHARTMGRDLFPEATPDPLED